VPLSRLASAGVAPASAPASPLSAAPESKRKTSRIPLEAALATAEQTQPAAEGATPKTIKLKRPGDGASVKVTPLGEAPEGETPAPEALPSEPVAEVSAEASKANLRKTVRLDETAELPPPAPAAASAAAEEGATPTRRKTIVVKRPTMAPRVGSPAPGPGDETSAEMPLSVPAGAPVTGAIPTLAPAPAEAKEGWVFPVLAIAAILVVCFGLYVQAVEVLNLSLPCPGRLP
jgi:hypothetical protein